MKSASALALLFFAPAASAQFTTIAVEDFENSVLGPLGTQNGGTGWFNAWYSGPGNTDALVTAPGLGASTQAATTNFSNSGSFRIPANAGFEYMLDAGRFGADGSTIWISFDAQRIMGGGDQYGGLSLNEQFVGEKLFIGSPWQTSSGAWTCPAAPARSPSRAAPSTSRPTS